VVDVDAVLSFRREVRGLRLPVPVLHVGVPGTKHQRFAEDAELDQPLWSDVVEDALAGAGNDAFVWVTRLGPPRATDLDLLWCAASVHAASRCGRPLAAFPVVTRDGWIDLLDDGTLHAVPRRAR
jgi:hypothetical protein